MNTTQKFSWKKLLRGLLGILFFLSIWQIFACSGMFSTALTPPLGSILSRLVTMLRDGTLIENLAFTMLRVFLGFGIAFCVAIPLGVLMARYWLAERFFLPIVSALMPIPSLAWVPLFVLWFGIGNAATVLVVIYAAIFPLIYNVWRGVTAVSPIWIRAASVMGADRRTMFRKVLLPGALPYIITGARLGFAHAWIGVIGGELLASPRYGLGELIFNAGQYLQTGTMISTLIVIGGAGVFFERLVFQALESATIQKWGMVTGIQ